MQVTKTDVPSVAIPKLRGSIAHLRYPVFAEVKVDGEFNFIVYRRATPDKEHKCFTINKYGTVRENFPALNNIESVLMDHGVNSAMLVCEVYWDDGKLGKLYELLSHKKDDGVNIAIFDIIGLNGDYRNAPLIDRLEALQEIGLTDWTPPSEMIDSPESLEEYSKDVMDCGWEGLVVKDLNEPFPSGNSTWTKMKYKDRSEYVVSIVDSTQERIEILAPSTQATQHGVRSGICTVGVKAPNKYKKHIKVGDTVTIEHQGVLASGSLRHPVLIPRKEWK